MHCFYAVGRYNFSLSTSVSCHMSVSPPLLQVRDLAVSYADKQVVRNLSFSLASGEIGCLLGSSGCGKTTALRAVAGFEYPSAGHVCVAGEEVARAAWGLPPEQRRVGMVFQDYALFPHLSIAANVAFGLRANARPEREARVKRLLDLVGLGGKINAYPHQLSGGQQQRVALARALAPCPRLLLLDEPFSSLDSDLRAQLAQEVRAILRQENITALLVTHDQHEAFAMADKIGVMNNGALDQWADGYTLYHKPATRFVANFIGEGVLLAGEADGRGLVTTELGLIRAGEGGAKHRGAVEVLLRPDDIQLCQDGAIRATIMERAFRGAEYLYTLRLPSGARLLSLMPSHHDLPVGYESNLCLCEEGLPVFSV
jgi:iron(III) transport system ATP-binding protein